MNFNQEFYLNIKSWYTQGIQLQDCHSRLLFNEQNMLTGFYLFQLNETTAYLMQMFVEQTYRTKGYGRLLLHDYEQQSVQKGAVSSFLHASSINTRAVSFYQKAGYHIIAEEADEHGDPRYLMYKAMSMWKGNCGYTKVTPIEKEVWIMDTDNMNEEHESETHGEEFTTFWEALFTLEYLDHQ
jgi:GNAT superfamily N-acetyltransferase